MSAGSYLAVLRAVDSLYQSVVTDPEEWSDQALTDWAADALADSDEMPREAIREIRRCLRAAAKLRSFWARPDETVADHDDWRTRVDIALGPRAWRPTLDLAQIGLADSPSEELFAEVKQRFAVVNSERWMDGVDFADWIANN